MSASVNEIKELREMTGAGMMDCKKALEEANEDMEKAVEILRKKGAVSAAKKVDRTASEGLVHAYIHGDGRIGVLVEVNIETDFAAKSEKFKALVHDIAMQIVASSPKYINRDQVPTDVVEKEKSMLRERAQQDGKSEHIIEKMIEGRLDKFFKEICLLEQPFIKDGDKTVEQIISEVIAVIGENIVVRRFARFERGEGIEKKQENFAEEVRKQMGEYN